MSHKNFAFARGDEADSDAFINSTLRSAPANNVEMQGGNFSNNTDGSYYVDLGREPEYKNRCARLVVYIWAVILSLIGIGFLAIGIMQKKESVLPICPNCEKLITGLIACGACVFVFGLIGAFAAHTRNGCIACVFAVILVVFGLVFLGLGVGMILLSHEGHMGDLWRGAVKHDQDAICKVQKTLKCSGYQFCCYFAANATQAPSAAPPALYHAAAAAAGDTNSYYARAAMQLANDSSTTTTVVSGMPSSTTAAVATTAAPGAPVPGCNMILPNTTEYAQAKIWCAQTCTDTNKYPAQSCAGPLKDKMHNLLVPVLATLFPVGFICLIVACSAYRMLSKETSLVGGN